MSFFKPVFVAGAVATLAACGGGGGGGSGVEEVRSFAELSEEFYAQADTYGIEPGVLDTSIMKNPSTLPTTGSSTYNGTLFLGNEQLVAAGELALTAGWVDSTISGSATNFVTSTNEDVSGSLRISNGRIQRNANLSFQPSFVGDIGGTLRIDDFSARISADIEGDFYGNNHQAVYGILYNGTAVANGETVVIAGDFIGER